MFTLPRLMIAVRSNCLPALTNFTINGSAFVQDISQNTEVESRTITRRGPVFFESLQKFRYPLTMNISFTVAADGSASQLTTASQEFKHDFLTPFFARVVDNTMNSTDTLNFNSAGAFTGNTGAKTSQKYLSFNTRGEKYSCSLTAENNVLDIHERRVLGLRQGQVGQGGERIGRRF
jgi:hypothetical protein